MQTNANDTIFLNFDNISHESINTAGFKAVTSSLITLIENMDEAIILVDTSLKIITFNKQFSQSYKKFFNKDVIKFDSILSYAVSHKKRALKGIYTNVFKGETIKHEIEFNVNGQYHVYRNTYKPLKGANGKIDGAFVTSIDITEQEYAKRSLLASEKRFRALIENSHDGINLLGADGTVQYITPSVEKILGYGNKEAIGMRPDEMIHPDDKEKTQAVLHSLIAEYGKTVTATYRMRHKNGSWRWLKSNITNLLHEPAVKALVFNYEDITDLVKAEEEKNYSRREIEALINNTTDWIWSVSPDYTLITCNHAFIEIISSTTGHFFKPGDNILLQALLPDAYVQIWQELYKQAFSGKPVFEELYTPAMQGRPQAWLEISMHPVFDEHKRVSSVACNGRDITQRKQHELELKKLNEKLETAQQTAKIGYWEFDMINNSLYWSAGIYNICGIKPGTAVNIHTLHKIIHPLDWNKFITARNEAIENGTTVILELRIFAANKSIKHTLLKVKVLYDADGNLIKRFGTVQDITERKQAEEQLARSEQNLRQAQEIAHIGSWELDFASQTEYWSPELFRILGLAPGETESTFNIFKSFIHPDDLGFVLETIQSSNVENKDFAITHRIIRKDGAIRIIDVKTHYNFDDAGNLTGISGILHDVTEQKLAEQKLAQSEKRFRALVENSHDGICLADIEGNISFVSDSGTKILGYNTAEVTGHNLFSFIHPDDKKLAADTLKAIRSSHGITATITYRARHKNGLWRWLKSNITNLLNEPTVNAYVFNYEDVTEQLANEWQVLESEAKYRSLYENSLDAILLTKPDGTIFSANPAACKIFGKTEEQICKEGRYGIVDVTDPRLAILLQERSRTGSTHGEVTLLRADGEKFQAEITSSVFTLSNNEQRSCIIIRDITERVIIEKQKEHVLQEKEALINTTTDLMWSIDAGLNFAAFNKAYQQQIERICGYTIKTGDSVFLAEYFKPEQVAYWRNLYGKVLSGISFTEELFFQGYNNIPDTWIALTLNPIFNNGKATGIACYGRDVTEIKQHTLRLQGLNQKLELAQHLAQLGYWEINVENNTLYWTGEMYKICGIKAGTPVNADTFSSLIHPDDKETFFRLRQQAVDTGRQMNLSLRIMRSDNTLRHVNLNITAAESYNGALVRMEGTLQDITEQKEAEKLLARSETGLRKAQQLAQIGSWEADLLTGENFWSDTLYNLFGVEKDQFEPSFENYMAFVHPEDKEMIYELVKRSSETLKAESYTHRIIRKDGAIRILYTESQFTFDSAGKPVGIFGIMQDITEHKQQEAERVKLLDLLQRSLNEIYIFDPQTLQLEYVNDGALKNLGYTKAHLQSLTLLDIQIEYTPEKYSALLGRLANTDKIIYETFHLRADGSFYPAEVHLQRIKHMDGYAYLCVTQDITERKAAGEKIKETQSHLKTIFENSVDGFVLLDKEGIVKTYNNVAGTTIFLNQNKQLQTGKSIFKYVPDDRKEAFAGIFKRALSGEKIKYDRPYLTATGENVWIDYTINAVYIEETLAGVCITGRDITERKLAEEKLERSEKRFRALIENCEDGIVLLDREGDVQYQSPSAERIFGYSIQDLAGKPIADIIHPADQNHFKQVFSHVIENPESSQMGMHRKKHKNGSWIWCETYITNLLYNSSVQALVINFRDVSQNIAYLNDIEEQNKMLHEITWMQSHVVRAPLARIMGLVHLLKSDALGEMNVKEALQHILTASEELDTVVKDIIHKAEKVEKITQFPTVAGEK